MGNPNFSVDSHLHVTYASITNEDYVIDAIKQSIQKANDKLSCGGELKLVHGYYEGVCIHTNLKIGGNYEYNGSVEDSLENITRAAVDIANNQAKYIEDKIEDDEGLDISHFLKDVLVSINIEIDGERLLIDLLDIDETLAYILNKNEELEYDVASEEGRIDLVWHVLDYEFWHKQCKSAFERLIDELQAAAKQVAVAHSMLELRVFGGGWSSALDPISTEEA